MIEAKELLSELNLSVCEYHISEIKDKSDNILGYHSTVMDSLETPIAGGFATSLNEANKIALAEFIERKTVKRFAAESKSKKEWHLDKLQTGCGFAVGFDKRNTLLRSICEGVERYVLSQWIDNKKPLRKVNPPLSQIGNYFYAQFESVDFYHVEVPFVSERSAFSVHIGATVGLSEKGAFLGSNAQVGPCDLWTHALLESFRHFLLSVNTETKDIFPYNRVHFFSKNKEIALKSIPRGPIKKLAAPSISFSKIEQLQEDPSVFIARTIFHGWRRWSEGNEDRFLY